jgi:integrase
MRMRISQSALKKLPRPDKGTTWVLDTEQPGFQLSHGKTTSRFYAFTVKNGKAFRKALGYWPALDPDRARLMAAKEINDHKMGMSLAREADSLSDVFDRACLARVKMGRLKPKIVEKYKYTLKKYCPALLKARADSITRKELENLRMMLDVYAFNHVMRILSATYRTLGLSNPCTGIQLNKERTRKSQIVDHAQWYTQVVAVQNPYVRNGLLLAALTGIRSENLRSLLWSQVDLDRKTIFLPQTKTNENVTLPLSYKAVELLQELKRLQQNERVFYSATAKDGYLTDLRRGQQGTTHDCRRTFSTAAAKCGIFGVGLKRLRGDKTTDTADNYVGDLVKHSWADNIATQLLVDWGILSMIPDRR